MTRQNVIELVEQAVRSEPHCGACGAPTTVATRSSGLWLECGSLGSHRTLLRRLADVGYDHTRRHLLDAEVVRAAA